jgi:hypothetical protein
MLTVLLALLDAAPRLSATDKRDMLRAAAVQAALNMHV